MRRVRRDFSVRAGVGLALYCRTSGYLIGRRTRRVVETPRPAYSCDGCWSGCGW
jgi:hypothetical protein